MFHVEHDANLQYPPRAQQAANVRTAGR